MTDRATGANAPVNRRLLLALLCAVFAIHFVDRQLLGFLITPIKAELGLSDTALGLLSGYAFTVVFSIVGLVIARYADRVDRARVIGVSLAVFSVMTSLCGFAASFAQLLLARVGVGIGEGGTNPASHALIADVFPPSERAGAMAVYAAGPHLGLVLAFGVGGWLAHAVGWRATFVIVGAAGLLLALVTSIWLRDPRSAVRGAPAPQLPVAQVFATLMKSRMQRHLFAAATLAVAGTFAALTWLPALLIRVHGMSLPQVGLFLAIAGGIVGAGCTWALGSMADAAGRKASHRASYVAAGCQALLAVLWIPVFLSADRIVVLLIAVVPCALSGAFVGPTLALVQDAADARARALSAAALLAAMNLVGGGAGPLLVGVLSDALNETAGPRALSYALLAVPVLVGWSAIHYFLAARVAMRDR